MKKFSKNKDFSAQIQQVGRIGTPFLRFPADLVPNWTPPQGNYQYYVAELAFTLQPPKRVRVQEARFFLNLSPDAAQRPVVLAAYPRLAMGETLFHTKLKLEPTLNFSLVKASLGETEADLNLDRAQPVIRTYGLQESRFCWRYDRHPKFPLDGSYQVAAVIAVPDSGEKLALEMGLKVVLKGKLLTSRVVQSVHRSWMEKEV